MMGRLVNVKCKTIKSFVWRKLRRMPEQIVVLNNKMNSACLKRLLIKDTRNKTVCIAIFSKANGI